MNARSKTFLELFDRYFHLPEMAELVNRVLASARKPEKSTPEPLRKSA
jgi:hypothetical protein